MTINSLENATPRAIIFAASNLVDANRAVKTIRKGDLVIAADGGGKHCLSLGITPHVLIGDLDSIEETIVNLFQENGTQVIRFPKRKDFTDLELALIYAQEQNAKEIIILGALGERWDQTLANLLLPAEKVFSDLKIQLIDGHQEIRLLRGGETITLYGEPGDTVSLVPLVDHAGVITTEGLEYPLNEENLVFGSTRGISNVLLERTAKISLGEGMLVIVLIHLD